ncbi:PTS sugar transporter subunit IIA [Altererythrobacter arenosus]|uniref:PTS sugar transporter subunit IIA n=1 Tax=Altererythrobacter arenosus TaxID=3032592 RepID=A0ABY8FUH1_9SPHN|nr:PTS sugar transporter subunit IIA [Altererythrobacter sp. CAU 1644]WFL78645.1 PTS sugar transporter subunit IIA [Altererythrobacter sp. CAU 1644]
MNVNFKLLPEAVATARLDSKGDVLQRVADIFADVYGIDANGALEGLEEREALGSTGFGRGVAIPHARSTQVNRPVVVLLRLEQPVDFRAADGMPVDLVFGLLSPENAGATHLHALAAISRLARDEAMHEKLAEAQNAEALFALISDQLDRDAA